MNQKDFTPDLNQYVTRGELYEFGRELAQTILNGFEAYMADFRAELNQKFLAIDQRFEAIDQRFEIVDQKFSENDSKFLSIGQQFDRFEAKFEHRFDYLDKRIDNLVEEVAGMNRRLTKLEKASTRKRASLLEA